jgi:hypothetical protein
VNFEDEHYVRVYTKDTKTWMRWGWEGQTVFMHLMRRLDKAGVLDDIEDPVPDVALLTGLPEEIVAKGLPRLLDSGTLQHINGLLVAPRYIEGQTSKRSDAVRAKESRERRRQTAMLSQIVTERHEFEPPVTSRDANERERSDEDNVTERDGAITNRDRTSQNVTERHANRVPRHSTQCSADQRRSISKADGGIPRLTGLGDAPPPSEIRQQRHSEVRSSKPEPKLEVAPPAQPLPPDWRPRNRQEALNAPIEQRAKWAMREQWAAAEYQPQEWPEVVLIAEAFHRAYRLASPKLGRLDSDKLGTQRIVSLLTLYTPQQVVKVCEALPSEKFSKDRIAAGERPRLGWLSDEVVRTSYGALPTEREPNQRVKRALANLEAQGFTPMKAAGEQ